MDDTKKEGCYEEYDTDDDDDEIGECSYDHDLHDSDDDAFDESSEAEKDNPPTDESQCNVSVPCTHFLDLFSLPRCILKAIVYFYDSDQWVCRLERLGPQWSYATMEEDIKERFIFLHRIKKMLKSHREQICISKLFELYYSVDHVEVTKYVTPIRDAIESCKTYACYIIPLYEEKNRLAIDKWDCRSGSKSLVEQMPYAHLFSDGDFPNNFSSTQDSLKKMMVDYVTTGSEKLRDQINDRKQILTRLLSAVDPNVTHCTTPIGYPVWLPKCIALLSNGAISQLISHNCFHLFRNEHHSERDYDVLRSLLLVSSIDCYVSRSPEDKQRFQKIVSSINHCLRDLMCNVFHFSDQTSARNRRGYDRAQHDLECNSIRTARIPLDRHSLVDGLTQNVRTSTPMPHLNALENLLTPSTWDTLAHSSIPHNIDRLMQVTRDVCNWDKVFDSNLGHVDVDQRRQRAIREEINLMGEDSILNKAMSMAIPYEVMRCFHISPVIVNDGGKDETDLRAKGKETAKACILLIMLSCVRNVVFTSSSETNCDTVVITSRAREGYDTKQTDLNIAFRTSSSIVLDTMCLDRVLTAIQRKEDIVL